MICKYHNCSQEAIIGTDFCPLHNTNLVIGACAEHIVNKVITTGAVLTAGAIVTVAAVPMAVVSTCVDIADSCKSMGKKIRKFFS